MMRKRWVAPLVQCLALALQSAHLESVLPLARLESARLAQLDQEFALAKALAGPSGVRFPASSAA